MLVVLTKIDKLSPAERDETRSSAWRRDYKGQIAAYPELFATSSLTGEGLDSLRCHIAALAAAPGFGL